MDAHASNLKSADPYQVVGVQVPPGHQIGCISFCNLRATFSFAPKMWPIPASITTENPIYHYRSTCWARQIQGRRCGRVQAPLRFSLACLGFSFLFRGVQRGYFSFQRERSEIMKVDELLISAKGLPWRSRFPLADHGSMSDSAIRTKPATRAAKSVVPFGRTIAKCTSA
jgi:hypothetical protein